MQFKKYFLLFVGFAMFVLITSLIVFSLTQNDPEIEDEIEFNGNAFTCDYLLKPKERSAIRSIPFAFGFHARIPIAFSPVPLTYNPYYANVSLDFPPKIPINCPFQNVFPSVDPVLAFRATKAKTGYALFIDLWRNDEAAQPWVRTEPVIVHCHLAWLSMCDDQCPDERPFREFRRWPTLVHARVDPGPTCLRFVLDERLYTLIPWEAKFDVYCGASSVFTGQLYGSPKQVLSFQTTCMNEKTITPPADSVETVSGFPVPTEHHSHFPLVTAMIVSYERPTLLDHAVRSLLSGQTYAAIEALVLDDSQKCAETSVVDEWEKLAQFVSSNGRRRVIEYVCMNQLHRENRIDGAVLIHDGDPAVYQWSIGAKRHFGVSLAHGEFIVHWDDDDWYAPERIAYQVWPMIRQLASMTVLTGRATLFLGQQLKDRHDAEVDQHKANVANDPVIGGEPGKLMMLLHYRCPPVIEFLDGPCQSVMYASLAYAKEVYDGTLVRYPFTSLAEDSGLTRRILLQHKDAWLPNRNYAIYVRHSSSAFDSDVVLGGSRRLDRIPEFLLPRIDREFYENVSTLPEVTQIRRPINAVCPFGPFKGLRAPYGIC